MDKVLAAIPLIGVGPILVVSAIGVFFLVLGILAWRNHKIWSILSLSLFVAFGLAAGADYVNTQFAYYDTAADLLGIPTYPTADGAVASGPDVEAHPDGAVVSIKVPDTASHFGTFDAKVWLPPQYFTDGRTHFPVVFLMAGNPGENTDWLTSAGAATTGLAVAKSGKPVILVMPTVLQNRATGDSLCVDTASQGNAETYITKDVLAAVDDQLRTKVDPKQRGIGGLSMGGFCALNLGLKHPDLYSVVLDFSGETQPIADTLPGGIQELFGANWQEQSDANNPLKNFSKLDPSKAPAIWFDCGTDDKGTLSGLAELAPLMKAKGFTVELHTRPGDHEFKTWTAALGDALPWAAARFYASP